jgi:hypothetical protein
MPKAEATLEHFGFRVSAFFRPSDFGLRDWPFALTGSRQPRADSSNDRDKHRPVQA